MPRIKSVPTATELQEMLFRSLILRAAARERSGPAGIAAELARLKTRRPFRPSPSAGAGTLVAELAKYDASIQALAVARCGSSPYSLSSALATLLASMCKSFGATDSSRFLRCFGKCALETSSPGSLQQIWDAAPPVEPPLVALHQAGHPHLTTRPSGFFSSELRAKHKARWVAEPSRYLFSEKEPEGYYEVDDNGVWDAVPTKKKTFLAKHSEFVEVGVDLETGEPIKEKEVPSWVFRIPAFTRRVFDYSSDHAVVTVAGIRCKNDYVRSRLEPEAGDWGLYRDLVMNLVDGDAAGFEWLLDWAARQLQELKKGKPFKMGTILVFYGVHRAGKGLFSEAMKLMYGASNTVDLNQTQMDGRFSGQLRGKLLVILNEVTSNTNRGPEVGNKLKNWATDPTVPIEAKGIEAGGEPNNFNLLFLSNFERPVYLEEGDGRYTFFEQTKKLDRALGKAIHDDQVGEQKQTKAFFAELLRRPTSVGFGDIYENDARSTQVREAEDSLMKFMREIAADGWAAVAHPWVQAERPDYAGQRTRKILEAAGGGRAFVPTSTILEVYADWCRRNHCHAVGSPPKKLGKAVEQLRMTSTAGKHQGVRGWFDFGEMRPQLQLVPPIPTAVPPPHLIQGLHCLSMDDDTTPCAADGRVPEDWELEPEPEWELGYEEELVPEHWEPELQAERELEMAS